MVVRGDSFKHFLAGGNECVRRFRGTFAILLPSAMPHIVNGLRLRLGLGLSWAYLLLGELTGVPNGLGAVIMDARMLERIDIIVLGVVIIAVVGRLRKNNLQGRGEKMICGLFHSPVPCTKVLGR